MAGFQSFGGFSSPGTNQLTVEQLLAVAKAQGGAVGEVAEELSHPKRSILSTVGEGFKNAFTGFLEIIAVPNQVVAGILSPEFTIKDAIEQNISVSDVVFGDDKRKNLTGLQKFGSFTARLAVDVLTDPLTYVTFGATRGVLGFASLPKFFKGEVSEDIRKSILANLDRKGITGEAAENLVAKSADLASVDDAVFLSVQGDNLANRFLNAQRQGLRHTFIKLDNKKILASFKNAGRNVTKDDLPRLIKEIEDGVHDTIIEMTLNARLSKSFAVATVGRMIEKNPQLIETLIDKGGIKFFSKSILSGQRIKSVISLIPGMSALDRVTQSFRHGTAALFSRDFTPRGKLPDQFIRIDQKYRDLADSKNNQLLLKAGKLFKHLGISENEDKFIVAAIEEGLRPSDARASAIWETLNGIMPDGAIIRPEVWKAAGFVKEQLKMNLISLRESGVPVASFANYVPHLLVKQEIKSIGFRLPPKQVAQAAKFASISAFVDDKGSRFIGQAQKIGDGDLEVLLKDGKKLLLDAQEGGGFIDDNFMGFVRERATIAEARVEQVVAGGKTIPGIEFGDSALGVMMLSSMDAIKVSASRNFVREIGEKMGQSVDKAPSFYRTVNVTGLKYEGNDIATNFLSKGNKPIVFHPDVAERIEKFAGSLAADEATENMLRQYDKLQNLFKATVTSIWPAFHGRNGISNVMLNFLDLGHNALQPKYHLMSAKTLMREANLGRLHLKMNSADVAVSEKATKEFGEQMRQIVFTDKTGYQWSHAELSSVIKNNVVAFHPRNLGMIDQVQFGTDSVREVSEKLFPASKTDKFLVQFQKVNPFSTKNVVVKTGLKFGSLVEDQARLVNFFGNLDISGDPLLAAERVKEFLFDYQNLSNFERKVMRRLVPFYTFTRKNLALQVKTLFRRPGAIAGEVRAVQTIGDALGAGDLTPEEREALPEWMQDGINTVLRREGSHVTVLSTIGSPVEQPFQQFTPNQALASLSPIFRVPVELLSGYSFFHGKTISEVTNAAAYKNAPPAIKRFIGFEEVNGINNNTGEKFTYYVSLRPNMMHLFNNLPPTSRALSTIKQLQKPGVDIQTKLWQQLVGFNPFDFDLELEAQRRETELRKELENVLDSANIGYSFTRFVIPDDSGKFKKF